ncbi:MAG: class I SAM-dependent methyltransferase [bacterium]|nr:class I SAM-dependent methyltransferase [bacterium]
MDKPMPNFFFNGMSAILTIRDKFMPPARRLGSVGIKRGDTVLDYGCGPGGYSVVAAEMVGETGKVYALDIQPLAGDRTVKRAKRKGLSNVEGITSGCATGLADESVDVALLYDIIHMLDEPDAVIGELHRILKPDGVFSVDCHHWKQDRVRETVESTGLFKLENAENGTFIFSK